MAFDTAAELARFGVAKSEILFLRPDSPSIVPFLDLVPSLRRPALLDDIWPEAVIQGAFGPIAYVVRNDRIDIDQGRRKKQLRRLQRRLSSRSAGAMLTVVSSAKLEVLPLGAASATAPITEILAQSSAPAIFRELATGSLPIQLAGKKGWHSTDWSIAGTLATLVIGATQRIEQKLANTEDSLMLVARAVLIRLMRDRGLIASVVRQELFGGLVFDTPVSALSVNLWLSQQFSGEMLELRLWNFNSVFAYRGSLSLEDRRSALGTLAEIFAQTEPADAAALSWDSIDFTSIRPIVVAEAFEQAIARLELGPSSRRVFHYTPADLATFMAEEAIRSYDGGAPTILTTSSDCGQMLIAALEELVSRQWERNGRRPSRTEIEQLMEIQLRGRRRRDGRTQLAAAFLSLAALEFSADAFPLDSRFPSPTGSVFSCGEAKGPFNIVIGDHANDNDYGRRALSHATAITHDGGVMSLCTGNRVIRTNGSRLPPAFRDHVRLTGIVADVKRSDRKNPVDIIFARNESPSGDSEFWLASPFAHRRPAPFVPSWVDASRTQPISQSLASQIPGLLAALPKITVLEAGVLVRFWRKLATPPASLELEDPALLAFCATLISDSLVGQFASAVLGAAIKLPTSGLAALPPSMRAEVASWASGADTVEELQVALIEHLCGVDSADFEIMTNYVREVRQPTLSESDFAGELANRLDPFFEGGEFEVSLCVDRSTPNLQIFGVSNRRGFRSDQDWPSIYETLASAPVASLAITPINGSGLMLWIAGRSLTSSLAWIVALDVLRNHADDIDGELWPSDLA